MSILCLVGTSLAQSWLFGSSLASSIPRHSLHDVVGRRCQSTTVWRRTCGSTLAVRQAGDADTPSASSFHAVVSSPTRVLRFTAYQAGVHSCCRPCPATSLFTACCCCLCAAPSPPPPRPAAVPRQPEWLLCHVTKSEMDNDASIVAAKRWRALLFSPTTCLNKKCETGITIPRGNGQHSPRTSHSRRGEGGKKSV